MAETTKIQWCHHTFNPWRGCAKVHTGCENCYAEKEAKRFPKNRGIWGHRGTRVKAADATWAEPLRWNIAAAAAGERRRVFCASLADVFEDWQGDVVDHQGRILHRCNYCGSNWAAGDKPPCECGRDHAVNRLTMNEMRRDLFAMIDRTTWLDWLLLTKRPERIGECWYPIIQRNANGAEVHDHVTLLRPNVWLLTSVSDQATAERMIPRLANWRHCAPVLGISVEPMIGPINFGGYRGLLEEIDWVIFGGESGHHARPCNLRWILDGINQCRNEDAAPFMKQAGGYPLVNHDDDELADWARKRTHLEHAHVIEVYLRDKKGGDLAELPEALQVREFPAVREGVLS